MPDRIVTHAELMSPRRELEYNRSRRGDQAFYRSARWLKIRAVILRRDPVCTICGREAAREVDHVLDRADRPDLELDPANLRGKCKRCHSQKTALTMHARTPGGPITIRTLR